jgi:hypothetical protein
MNPAVAGTIASSSDYNVMLGNVNQLNTTRTKYKRAECTSTATVTGTVTDLPGASISFNTAENNTVVFISAVFDVNATGNTDVFIGSCQVDGVSQGAEAIYRGSGRATVSQQWMVTIATAGAHTAKLRVVKAGSTDAVTANSTHSNIVLEGQGVT